MSDTKETNPKELIGSSKLPLHLWPTTATAMGCLGLLEGLKYGRSNFRDSGVKASTYYDALKRHMDAWWEGEEMSKEGVPHLANALACIAIIVDSKATGMLQDDRAYRGEGYRSFVDELTKLVPNIRDNALAHGAKHFSIADSRPVAKKRARK